MPALDGLRGLAILGVLLLHFFGLDTPSALVTGSVREPAELAVARLVSYGGLGVDLFFILSGFLITGILYDSRSDPAYFRNFYMRRLLRIFPLYYGVLVVLFLVVPAIPAFRGSEIADLREHQAWAWLYAVNIYLAINDGWVLPYIQHFWSLAIEEHFYLVWPLLVWWLASKPRHLMAASLAVCAVSFAGRVVASLAGLGPVSTYVLTPLQLDGLAMGGFFAVYLRQQGADRTARRAIVVLLLMGLALMFAQYVLRHFTSAGSVQELGNAALSVRLGGFRMLLAALVLQVVCAPPTSLWSRVFSGSPLVFLGKYSYGLYVYHHFVSYYLDKNDVVSQFAAIVGSRLLALALQGMAGIAVSMVIAWLSYEYFEKYFLGLKRYWSPAHDAAPSARGGVTRDPVR